MAASPYVGKWRLVEIIDADSNVSKPLPEGNEAFEADIAEDGDGFLRIGIKIGNNMRSKITLIGEGTPESQRITMGGILSTRMMPPPEVFAVEKFWSKTCTTVTKMELDGDKLTFVGEGKIVLTK